jgi:hypothetical protein
VKQTLLIPLDNRPCTARFPQEIAAVAGFEVRIPPLDKLGNIRKPADSQALEHWLVRHAPETDLVILSLDTWLYGGLVYSRKVTTAQDDLEQRLAQLIALKERWPALRLAVFGTLLRLSDHNDATEERSYWAQYGKQIHRLSWLEHKYTETPQTELMTEIEQLKTWIPMDILEDYRALRQRNFNLLTQCLELTEHQLFEAFYIGCDDSAAYGWNVQEKNLLADKIRQRKNLSTPVLLYPGADEIACTLLMKCLLPETSVHPEFSFPDQATDISLYEGIPLQQSLTAQAQAAGIQLTQQAAAIHLWIHNPPTSQTDQYLDRTSRQPITPTEYQYILEKLTATVQPVILADVCYANGGDQQLLEQLERHDALSTLKGYGAWNTTGNTLGFALAWAKAMAHAQKPILSFKLFLERLLDDGWYQGMLRQRLCTHYAEPVTLESSLRLLSFAKDKLHSWQDWIRPCSTGAQADIRSINFPWRRFFEIELSVCLKNSADKPPEDQPLSV